MSVCQDLQVTELHTSELKNSRPEIDPVWAGGVAASAKWAGQLALAAAVPITKQASRISWIFLLWPILACNRVRQDILGNEVST